MKFSLALLAFVAAVSALPQGATQSIVIAPVQNANGGAGGAGGAAAANTGGNTAVVSGGNAVAVAEQKNPAPARNSYNQSAPASAPVNSAKAVAGGNTAVIGTGNAAAQGGNGGNGGNGGVNNLALSFNNSFNNVNSFNTNITNITNIYQNITTNIIVQNIQITQINQIIIINEQKYVFLVPGQYNIPVVETYVIKLNEPKKEIVAVGYLPPKKQEDKVIYCPVPGTYVHPNYRYNLEEKKMTTPVPVRNVGSARVVASAIAVAVGADKGVAVAAASASVSGGSAVALAVAAVEVKDRVAPAPAPVRAPPAPKKCGQYVTVWVEYDCPSCK